MVVRAEKVKKKKGELGWLLPMICDAIMALTLLHINMQKISILEKKKRFVSFMVMIMTMMLMNTMLTSQGWCLFLFRVLGLHCMVVW